MYEGVLVKTTLCTLAQFRTFKECSSSRDKSYSIQNVSYSAPYPPTPRQQAVSVQSSNAEGPAMAFDGTKDEPGQRSHGVFIKLTL